MKTTTRSNSKAYHVGLRLDDEAMLILDKLCADLGGASHSRVLRRMLVYLQSDPSNRYVDDRGQPAEMNHRRREFVDWFRKMDDATINSIIDGVEDAVRRR